MKYRTLLAVFATAVVISACALVWYLLPQNTQIYAPFDVRGTMGSPTEGRGVTATVTSVEIGPKVVGSRGQTITAAGVWVVVNTEMDAGPVSEVPHIDLLVGSDSYANTDRLLPGPAYLQPGITQRRAWVFDVATNTLDAAPSVALRVWVGDPRLDSRLVIDVPLDNAGVHRVDLVDIPPAAEAAR